MPPCWGDALMFVNGPTIRVEATKSSEPSKVSSRPFFIVFPPVFEPVVAVTTRCPGTVTRSSLDAW